MGDLKSYPMSATLGGSLPALLFSIGTSLADLVVYNGYSILIELLLLLMFNINKPNMNEYLINLKIFEHLPSSIV